MLRGCIAMACAAVAVAAFAAAPSHAATTPLTRWDPQDSNVPYLAWKGDKLRLVLCTPEITVTVRNGQKVAGFGQTATFVVETWSDDSFDRPSIVDGTTKFFFGNDEHNGEACVQTTVTSPAAGLARIQLDLTRAGKCDFKHEFLVGWLDLDTPTIREVSAATGPNDPPGGGGPLGDPLGDGNFYAGDLPGRVQAQVFGLLPLGPNWADLRDLAGAPYPAAIRLPSEKDGSTLWDDLAHSLAHSTDPVYASTPWDTWDIHDDRTRAEGHVSGSLCNTPDPPLDAVDDCLGADIFEGDGRYSTAFGTLSDAPTIGPFDPLRPAETLLPDGLLGAGDVPMPAARVEFAIKANAGYPDLGGVGALALRDPSQPNSAPELAKWIGVTKCVAYTRANDCARSASNHYAPFYRRWLPATAARQGSLVTDPTSNWPVWEASGSTTYLPANDPGYLSAGLYDYWRLAAILGYGPGGLTSCLRAHDGNPATPDLRLRPSGPQRVAVYSDEHGEAQVYFSPGVDFFYDNLGLTGDLPNGCDLEHVTELGHADITAIARLPKYPTAATDRKSAPIRKTVRNHFHKEVKCTKGTVSGDTTSFICVAHGQDVDGSPFVGEHVCFMTNTTGMRPYPFGTPGSQEAINRLCMELDEDGNSSVEVFCKDQTGNVIADFDDEGISRFDIFDCKKPTPLPTTTTTTTTTPSTSTPTSTTLPTTTTAPTTTTTTTTPTDVCPNIPGAQPTLPPGFGIVNGSCVQDVCPNLSGVQTQVPLGFGVVNGNCIADVCPNLGGVQTQVPLGYRKVSGQCVKPPDVCPNLAGAQSKVPKGMVKVAGKCAKKIVVKKAKKVKKKPKVCYLNGRPVSPCVRGKG